MKNKIKEYTEKMFENVKHIDENGNEYWLSRELMTLLGYSKWERFSNTIENSKLACEKSGYEINEHFPETGKMIKIAKGAQRKVLDYKLSRYACYLIVQNGDSRKEAIALGQTYFAIQTRKQELTEREYSMLTEDEKRFYQRDLTRKGNYSLNIAAKNAGVKNFDKFHNSGYMGLYNGETANDIAKRKKLRYREDILDNMCSEELSANLFRITHGDYDHMGYAFDLVNNFKVKNVIFNCGEFNELEQDLINVLDKKKIPYYSCIKELNISDNKLYFLNNKDYGNENDNSSVIYTELNNHKFLFMGAAGIEVEEDLKKYIIYKI